MRLIFIVLFFLILPRGYAQDNPYNEVSISSPTAASLAKYADIPVNYHTGTPEISVPIYSIKEGSLSLPVSLSYHASGLKVMEPASWVGAGWSLNAGGVITRSVRGAPDEKQTSSVYDQTNGYFSDNGYSSYYYKEDETGEVQDWGAFADGKKDGEPDLYFFNFNGITGKFHFREDQEPVLLPNQDVTIKPDYSINSNESISRWVLTTSDGTRYYFGKTPDTGDIDPVEVTRPFTEDNGMGQSRVISSWYLYKIASSNGRFEITLSYKGENYSNYTLSMFPVQPSSDKTEYKLIKNLVEGVRLSKITFSGGQVVFNEGALRQDVAAAEPIIGETSNEEARVLDNIRILSNGEGCREFDFNIGYFTDNTSSLPGKLGSYTISIDRKKLKLNSVQEQTCDGSLTIPPYSFTYYDESDVPRRLSFAQDHWGFYNGASQNDQLIPTYYINDYEEVVGADREPAWPEMRAGALKRINRPTGGYTDFEFESHDTFISDEELEFEQVVGITTGYDSNPWNETTFTAERNTKYKIVVSNDDIGGSATAYFHDENNNGNEYAKVHAKEGETVEEVLQLSSGTNRLRVRKEKPSGSPMAGVHVRVLAIKKQSVDENRLVGGLRIKNIIHQDGMSGNPAITKNFEYENGVGRSAGSLYSRPIYAAVIRNDLVRDYGFYDHAYEGCPAVGNKQPYYISPSSIRPMQSTQGNHIGYREVKVTESDGGYTSYEYYGTSAYDQVTDNLSYNRVFPEECTADLPNYPAAPPQTDFRRGKLKKKMVYDALENTQAYWEYFYTYELEENGTPAFIAQRRHDSSQILGTKYEMKTAKLTEMEVIKTQKGRKGEPDMSTSTRTIYGNEQMATAACKSVRASCESSFDNKLSSCRSSYYAALQDCGSDSECKLRAWLDLEQCQFQARDEYLTCQEAYSCFHHQLPAEVYETGSNDDTRLTEYLYAHEENKYRGMKEKNMLTQPYKVTTKDGSGDIVNINWTLWKLFDVDGTSTDYWQPCGQWTGGPVLGTSEPSGC